VATPFNFGSVGTRLTAGATSPDLMPADSTAFRVLVLADLGGRARGAFRTIRVDRDNFDSLPGKLGVTVRLGGFGPGDDLAISINEIDDFSPDRLWEAVPAFDELRKLRRKLQTPATFADAAAVIATWDAPAGRHSVADTATELQSTDEPPNFLEQMLGQPIRRAAPDAGEIGEFIRQTAAKYAVASDDPHTGDLTGRVDAAISGLMRDILHHLRFQAVEAAWRGLAFLVKRLDTDEAIHLAVLDIGKDELAADLAAEDLSASKLYDLLVRKEVETPGGTPWALLVGDCTFEPTVADAELLGRTATVLGRAGAAFVAAASPKHIPDDREAVAGDATAAWTALRALPEAGRIGLALPRMLMRPPYGKGSCSVEGFDFEEATDRHDAYLWGNPAFAWAYVLAAAFERGRWGLRSSLSGDVADLPLVVVERAGTKEAVPCAELLLPDSAAARIAAKGFAVLQSERNANRAVFSSLAPLAGERLVGRWE
jgi:type VI secretion system protein ImpC